MAKPKQTDLFAGSDAAPVEPPANAALALRIDERRMSPEQQRFNKLLQRIDKLTEQIDSTRSMGDRLVPHRSNVLQPLEAQSTKLEREMVQLLHERLQTKGLKLTPVQLRTAKSMICSISLDAAMDGDAEMTALHDAHSEQSIEQLKQAAEDDARAYFGEVLGEDEAGPGGGEEAQPIEELMRAAMEKIHAQQAQVYERQAATSKAKGKQTAKANQRQQKAALEQQDAQAALKTIYRQLASALHPDRESDAAERVRKTALMGEANAAYGRRDLLALLKLQLKIEQIDADGIASMAKERLAALALLLKEQVAALEEDLEMLEQRLKAQFGMEPYLRVTEGGLLRCLQEDREDLLFDIEDMTADMKDVKTDAGLKQWLKMQNALMKADARMAREMPFDAFF